MKHVCFKSQHNRIKSACQPANKTGFSAPSFIKSKSYLPIFVQTHGPKLDRTHTRLIQLISLIH